MNWIKIIVLFAGISLAFSCKQPTRPVAAKVESKPLIEASQLAAIANHDSIVIIDMRKPEDYAQQHIPGAVNIWRSHIQLDTLPYSGIVASKMQIEALLGDLGITNNHFLVLYDDNASCDAARLWWALDHYGFDRMALLNGGLSAWKQVGKLTNATTTRAKEIFTFPENHFPARIVTVSEMSKAYNDSSLVIIDSRTLEEYSGYYKKSGAYDSGRIPNSIHIDWAENVDFETQRFKSIDVIKANYKSRKIDSTSNIVVYCHSGVRSAHTTYVLTQLLGFKNVRNYDGSWTEWSYYGLPVERTNNNEELSIN